MTNYVAFVLFLCHSIAFVTILINGMSVIAKLGYFCASGFGKDSGPTHGQSLQ
jgi:membrane protein DedA with SNARE-associated domain